jgi:hypothetical protein
LSIERLFFLNRDMYKTVLTYDMTSFFSIIEEHYNTKYYLRFVSKQDMIGYENQMIPLAQTLMSASHFNL